MKHLLLLTVSALALSTPTVIQAADPDGMLMEQVKAVVPPQYVGYISLAVIASMILGRVWTALLHNGGLRGIWNAVISGTNTPLKLLIASLCLLALPSCSTDAQSRLEFAALTATASAAQGYAANGKAGAIQGAATGFANALTPAAKQPKSVQP